MNAERWKLTNEVLQDVLELLPSERQVFLDRAGLFAEVKEEVESLLALEECPDGFMSVSAGSLSGEMVLNGQKENHLRAENWDL
jgi:hypothetical protein